MAKTITKTILQGATEVIEKYKERRGWFLFFPITWYEKISVDSIGNDIFIQTNHEIRHIYLNGKVVNLLQTNLIKNE